MPGELIAVCSATGGTGRTMITVNISVILASRGNKVAALDGDLQFGDLCMAMDVVPANTITDVVTRDDGKNVSDFYERHVSGVEILAAPERPEEADYITENDLSSILNEMKANSDYVLVDTMPGFSERSLSIMELSDQLLIVTSNGMAALKNTKLMLETLEKLNMKSKASIIVNRSTSLGSIRANELNEMLDTNQLFYLSNDYKHVSYSLETGIPFVTERPKLEISKAMFHMVDTLFPYEQKYRTNTRKRLLQKTLRPWKK
ncbi:AAA family ATPase [Alteribacillus iranensis]|uniref:Pilus assembly protein CpaE n=1 Tax=Alteribacillus iranensis TaxID=930128 RepID=A0A1I2EW41_9BACI|nr:AAA family ATPase [Alteribacillus iranensis]SFE96551.1 pilus assembly protein CpaE [Alteribacillus iranensis]